MVPGTHPRYLACSTSGVPAPSGQHPPRRIRAAGGRRRARQPAERRARATRATRATCAAAPPLHLEVRPRPDRMEREILGDLHRQICGFLESSASAAAEPAAPGSKRPRVEEPSAGRDAAVDLLSARAALEEQKVLREMDAERFSAQLEAEKARRSAAEERARRAAVDASARAEEIASSRVAAERSQSDAREKQLTERIARLVKSVADSKNEAERHRADADRLRGQ